MGTQVDASRVLDLYEKYIKEEIVADCDNEVFFKHSNPLVYVDIVAFGLILIGEFKSVTGSRPH